MEYIFKGDAKHRRQHQSRCYIRGDCRYYTSTNVADLEELQKPWAIEILLSYAHQTFTSTPNETLKRRWQHWWNENWGWRIWVQRTFWVWWLWHGPKRMTTQIVIVRRVWNCSDKHQNMKTNGRYFVLVLHQKKQWNPELNWSVCWLVKYWADPWDWNSP